MSTEGSSNAVADAFCTRGQPSGTGFRPDAEGGCPEFIDPFADLPIPEPTGPCEPRTVFRLSGGDQTIGPGRYCGGLKVQHVHITLEPGEDIIEGQLNITAGARLTGDGVTLILAGDDAGFLFNGAGEVNLTARRSR